MLTRVRQYCTICGEKVEGGPCEKKYPLDDEYHDEFHHAECCHNDKIADSSEKCIRCKTQLSFLQCNVSCHACDQATHCDNVQCCPTTTQKANVTRYYEREHRYCAICGDNCGVYNPCDCGHKYTHCNCVDCCENHKPYDSDDDQYDNKHTVNELLESAVSCTSLVVKSMEDYVDSLRKDIAQLNAQNTKLKEENATLKEQLEKSKAT